MPVVETRIQDEYIMKFLCRSEQEGGLGYRDTAPSIVSADLFIPSQLGEFIESANPLVWKSLMEKFGHDRQALQNALKEDIRQRLLNSSNVATFLNKNRTITFEGETVPLFFVSNTDLNGDKDFNKNIFAVVQEMPYNVVCDGMTIKRLRPDISFFINGIFLCYLELKSVTNGQTAARQGRGKIICDYLECVQDMTERERLKPEEVRADRKSTLQIFERGIHLVATDVNETYMLRGIANFYDEARKGFYDRNLSIPQIRPMIEKEFKLYPELNSLLPEDKRFESTMRNIYSKKMIEKEIIYYNFLQYNYKKESNGKRIRISNTGTLIAPRPKQKFGVDKLMRRVSEMLDKEIDPDYYVRRLRAELELLGVGTTQIDDIIRRHEAFTNNKYVYSLLLQYAAGFGKSNIIGWTALQLKDLRYDDQWAYDKILIVVDRLQLRDQLDEMMYNMNIDKSMFIEATNQQTFVEALAHPTKRIIVVNIQKFMELQSAINRSHKRLDKMRVAFLIDEIHRSNTGENNKEMLNIFERLQQTICHVAEGAHERKKKNLIIGFTATPSPKVLARFGELKSDRTHIPLWVPFDSYTMKEAIKDGYILDPTEHIIKVSKPMHFEMPGGVDPNEDTRPMTIRKIDIYRNSERMEELSHFIVNRLVSLVYGKIHGTGKAMLAVSSVPNAIAYCNLIREYMRRKCEDSKYSRYKDAPVSIVYSDSQEYPPCSSMNLGKSEEQVIKDFKQAKNGLMIVVDKLQTGFDEKKLHTLFLDKEISGINAIQTISRVNRKCKYKEDCHVIDLSWHNVNVKNIREAFQEFCDTVISDFNPENASSELDGYYRDLSTSAVYERWFNDYRVRKDEVSFILQMEDGIRQWIRIQFERAAQEQDTSDDIVEAPNEARRIRRVVGKYGSILMMLDEVYEIDKKYYDTVFLKFWETYCRIYRSMMTGNDGNNVIHPDVEVDDEIPGITIFEVAETVEDNDSDEMGEDNGSSINPNNTPSYNLLQLIQRWNRTEQLTAEEIQKWRDEILKMFEDFHSDARFMAKIEDDNFTSDQKYEAYLQKLNVFRRGLSRRTDIEKVQLLKTLLQENAGQLYDMFVEGK